jgi:hypothetical protein
LSSKPNAQRRVFSRERIRVTSVMFGSPGNDALIRELDRSGRRAGRFSVRSSQKWRLRPSALAPILAAARSRHSAPPADGKRKRVASWIRSSWPASSCRMHSIPEVTADRASPIFRCRIAGLKRAGAEAGWGGRLRQWRSHPFDYGHSSARNELVEGNRGPPDLPCLPCGVSSNWPTQGAGPPGYAVYGGRCGT